MKSYYVPRNALSRQNNQKPNIISVQKRSEPKKIIRYLTIWKKANKSIVDLTVN